jgi:hypothetical protein
MSWATELSIDEEWDDGILQHTGPDNECRMRSTLCTYNNSTYTAGRVKKKNEKKEKERKGPIP